MDDLTADEIWNQQDDDLQYGKHAVLYIRDDNGVKQKAVVIRGGVGGSVFKYRARHGISMSIGTYMRCVQTRDGIYRHFKRTMGGL